MKKILVIRCSSIGDIVLTSPVIRCMKQQIKDVEIHFLVKKPLAQTVESNPHISKVITFKKTVQSIMPELRQEKYDYIVDLHNSIRSTSVVLNLVRPFYTFKKINFRKWLMVNFKIDILPNRHVVDRYFDVVKSLNVANDDKGLEYFFPELDKVNATDFPETHQKGYIGFVIGGKHATKRMPESLIISLCNKIDRPIILLGAKEDFEVGEVVKNAVGDKVFNSCGKYSLNQSASIVKDAEKIITNDTGLMHIAAAFDKPIVSVWGNTIPEFGMTPYYSKDSNAKSLIAEVKDLSCRPCSKLGYEKCPKGHFKCMNLINEDLIVNFINKD
ncbi:MAG: glycosyltransferase family 9 protein [Bacteroidetes bacterium]|nr:glycosyltransferase family 9 protein [Bacteroidota bacterium]